jgi:hypothetical protein
VIRERDIERRFVKLCKLAGYVCAKWVSPGLRGVPDRMVLMPGGRVEFVELKAPGEKATAQQKRRHAELRALGFTVSVLSSDDDLDAWSSGGA